jgi:organic radical activating enzyme
MKENNDVFCVLPWIHLATHPIGTVTPCCITDMTNAVSTAAKEHDTAQHLFLSRDTLDDIANSARFKEMRKEMMNGESPKICQKCYKYDQGGVKSKRVESNTKFEQYIKECLPNTNPDGSLINVNYRYIELRLGTVCNLKCITCNPFSSNRWNQDLEVLKDTEFEKDYFTIDIKTEWYRDHNFYDELYSKSKGLKEIWINGGEPTLIKEHTYFLEKFINDGTSKDVDLHYSLNCTQFPDKFIEIWKNFNKVRIQLSIDDLGERNEYIRFPSDWNIIYDSFQKILKYKNEFDLEVCQTISSLNVMNIDNFKKFTLDNDIMVSHNFVHYPSHLQVNLIPDEYKKKLLDNLQYLRIDEVERLKIELFKPRDEEDVNKFYHFVSLLDLTRNVQVGDYLEEWKVPFENYIKNKDILI